MVLLTGYIVPIRWMPAELARMLKHRYMPLSLRSAFGESGSAQVEMASQSDFPRFTIKPRRRFYQSPIFTLASSRVAQAMPGMQPRLRVLILLMP